MLNKEKVKLGIAPIAWTNDDLPDLGSENTFEQCVSEMALAGYTGSEVGNKYPKNVEVLKRALRLRKMEICNQWFSSYLLTKPFEEVEREFHLQLRFLHALGAKRIGVSEQSYSIQGRVNTPVFGHKYVMNNGEWFRLCSGLERLGETAKMEYDIDLVYHHHMGTVIQTAQETDYLMSNTNPKDVNLLFDSGHFAYCGEDPVSVLQKHISRVKHVHLKDIRLEAVKKVRDRQMSFLNGVREGTFTIPGDGCVDFPGIFDILEEENYEGYLVVEAEQDPAKANPLEYAMRAREYLKEQTGL